MKTFFISAIFLFVIAVGAKAQTADTTLVIQFASVVHDYGTIQQGSDGGCEFKFENAIKGVKSIAHRIQAGMVSDP